MDLKEACKVANFDRIIELFTNGTSMNVICHYACEEGCLDVVKFAFANGVERDSVKGRWLHVATQNRHSDVLRYLLKEQHVTYNKEKVFEIACKQGAPLSHPEDLNCIKVFLESVEEERDRRMYLNVGLNLILREKQPAIELVSYLFDQGANPNTNSLDYLGKNNVELLKVILQKVVLRCANLGTQPSHSVICRICAYGSLELLRNVFERWSIPLHFQHMQFASEHENIANMEYVLSKFENFEQRLQRLGESLTCALQQRKLNLLKHTIRMLKNETQDKNLISSILGTKLLDVYEFESAKYLMDEGADIPENLVDQIMHNIYKRRDERYSMVKYFLSKGAKPSKESLKIAMAYEIPSDNPKLVKLLLRYNAPIPAIEEMFRFPLLYISLLLFVPNITDFLGCVQEEKFLDVDSIVFKNIV